MVLIQMEELSRGIKWFELEVDTKFQLPIDRSWRPVIRTHTGFSTRLKGEISLSDTKPYYCLSLPGQIETIGLVSQNPFKV